MLTSLYYRRALSNTFSLTFWDSQQLSDMLTHQTSKETVSFLHHPFFLKLPQCLWSPVLITAAQWNKQRDHKPLQWMARSCTWWRPFWIWQHFEIYFSFKRPGLIFFSPSWGNTQASHFQKVVPRFSNHERTSLSRWMLTHTMRTSRVSEVSTFNSDYLPCNISSIHSLSVVSPAFEQGGASF